MKSKASKLLSKSTKKTVEVGGAVKSIHLSFEIKCEKEFFEHYIRESAQVLTALKLEKVKTLSIKFELLD
ncbi:MAG: hypothetical protein ACR2J3_02545 [Aridibacter sp.]